MGGFQPAEHSLGAATQNRAQILVLEKRARHEIREGAFSCLVEASTPRSLETQQGRTSVQANQVDFSPEDALQGRAQSHLPVEANVPPNRSKNPDIDIAVGTQFPARSRPKQDGHLDARAGQ
jgi:hypothetical protein